MGFQKFKKFRGRTNVNKSQPLSRKEIRKQQRKDKKLRKVALYEKSKGLKNTGSKKDDDSVSNKNQKPGGSKKKNHNFPFQGGTKQASENFPGINTEAQKEKSLQDKLTIEMKEQRKRQLLEANKEEDKIIRKLEKQLKINTKSKRLPKSFMTSGLDYILEVCDSDRIRNAVSAETDLNDSGSEFEEDLALITGKSTKLKGSNKPIEKSSTRRRFEPSESDGVNDSCNSSEEDMDSSEESDDNIDEEKSLSSFEDIVETKKEIGKKSSIKAESSTSLKGKKVTFSKNVKVFDDEPQVKKPKMDAPKRRKVEMNKSGIMEYEEGDISDDDINEDIDDGDIDDEDIDDDEELNGEGNSDEEEECSDDLEDGQAPKQNNSVWEDIYGRKRDKDGNIIKETYVPPHLRNKSQGDEQKSEALKRLAKHLKGLLNRLAESNMHSISKQIEDLYMRNSRHDMNETLLNLFLDSLVSHVATPERLIMEHAMLLAILHANVGTEVGAYMLHNVVKKLDEIFSQPLEVEDKIVDNVLLIIIHFYSFKIIDCILIYDILEKLCSTFGEKEVELIILILKTVGFSLRKDNPLSLKELVLRIQKLANEKMAFFSDNSRVKFMLEMILSIKNNNISKLTQYDNSHCEHLLKIMKTMLHKGNYVTELKISLEDLLKADERGKWWVVGSAWSGGVSKETEQSDNPGLKNCEFSQEILQLARKQRMNTTTRRNIFCILMTAEDFMDAFEKLMRLGLKGQPQQEIVHVLYHCLLQEANYNPYYSYIARQLCISNRKHQMTIQYSLWDRIKELKNLKKHQITNLAKFLAHLFLEKALPISVLKVMELGSLESEGVRLLRQVLLAVLLHEDEASVLEVFSRISGPPKLHLFREALRLFFHHFLLRNVKENSQQAHLLKQRVEQAEEALTRTTDLKFISGL